MEMRPDSASKDDFVLARFSTRNLYTVSGMLRKRVQALDQALALRIAHGYPCKQELQELAALKADLDAYEFGKRLDHGFRTPARTCKQPVHTQASPTSSNPFALLASGDED